MLTPLLVLPNVTHLQKGNRMHRHIATRIVLFQENNPIAIQFAAYVPIEGIMESLARTALNYRTLDLRMHYVLDLNKVASCIDIEVS